MARHTTNGWELVGNLIGLGIVAAGAYTVHTRMQEVVDSLVQAPFDEALEMLAAFVPTLDDEVWELFASVLRSRSVQSRKARQLLDFASDVRETAPHLQHLLHVSAEDAVRGIFHIVQRLTDETWLIFQLTFAGFAQRDASAATLLRFAISVRKAVVMVNELLKKPLATALNIGIQQSLLLDDERWRLFQATLEIQAATRDDAQHLLTTTNRTRELYDLAHQIAAHPPATALHILITSAPQLDGPAWNLLQSLFSSLENTPVVQLVRDTLPDLRVALNTSAHVLVLSMNEAKRTLANIIVVEPPRQWQIMRMVLAVCGKTNTKARLLNDYAAILQQTEPFVQQLLETSSDTTLVPLAEALLSDRDPSVLIDLLAAATYHNPATQPLLQRALIVQRYVTELDRVIHLPRALAEQAVAQLVSTLDNEHWRIVRHLLVLHTARDQRRGAFLGHADGARAIPLRSIVEKALADGIITQAEQRTIDEMSTKLGVGSMARDRIINEAHTAYEHRQRVEKKLRTQIHQALEDGIVTPEERAAIDDLRVKLNVTTDLVERIFTELASEREQTTISPQDTTQSAIQALPLDVRAQVLRQQLRLAFSDKHITAQEGTALEALRHQLQLSADHARQLLREVQAEHGS